MIIYQAKTFRIEATKHALERIAERYPDMTQRAVIEKLKSARRATESELRTRARTRYSACSRSAGF